MLKRITKLARTSSSGSQKAKATPEEPVQDEEVPLEKVFDFRVLMDKAVFGDRLVTLDPSIKRPMEGNLVCTVTTHVELFNGDNLLVYYATDEGLWIGIHLDNFAERVLTHKGITQCALLDKVGQGLFLVLAERSLYAYELHSLVPHPKRIRPAEKINSDVEFFAVGEVRGLPTVAYMKKVDGQNMFHVLEPDLEKIGEIEHLRSVYDHPTTVPTMFHIYREYFLQHKVLDIYFLGERLAVVCSDHFELINVDTFRTERFSAPKKKSKTFKIERAYNPTPLGFVLLSPTSVLLCYSDFGTIVPRQGEPPEDCVVQRWKGKRTRMAVHAPYIMLFDLTSIEIRRMTDLQLMQIIATHQIICLEDGRGRAPSFLSKDPSDAGVDLTATSEPLVRAYVAAMSEHGQAVHRIVEVVPALTPVTGATAVAPAATPVQGPAAAVPSSS